MTGLSYERAYRHFRTNHTTPFNIICHALGLGHTLIANFALLHTIDAKLARTGIPDWLPTLFGPVFWVDGWVASTTLYFTLIGLVMHTGPFLAKLGAVFNVLWTYFVSVHVARNWRCGTPPSCLQPLSAGSLWLDLCPWR